MKKYKLIEAIIFFTSVFCLITTIIFDSYLNVPPLITSESSLLDTSFDVYRNDKKIKEDIKLPNSIEFDKKTDLIKIETILPKVEDNISLNFKTRTRTIEVYIDNQKRYSFLGEGSKWNKPIVDGATYHFVPLRESDSNKKLEVIFNTGFRKVNLISLDEITIGPEISLYEDVGNEKFSLIFGIFLLYVGLESLIGSFLIKNKRNKNQIRSYALIAFALGLWVFSQSKSKVLIIRNPVAPIELSYYALYLLPYGFCKFIKSSFNLDVKFLKVINSFVLIYPLIYIIIFILQLLGLSKQLFFLIPMASFIIIFLLSVIIYLLIQLIKGQKELRIFLIAVSFLIISFIIELISFNKCWFFKNASPLHFGMFLFGLGLLIIVLQNLKKALNEMVHFEAQAKIAFIDGLTNLGNRQCYNRDLLNCKNIDFTFFMIDVNKMKDINDQFGHIKGDEALQALAKIISQVFNQKSQYYRYGGDEFVIFYLNIETVEINKIIKKFNKLCNSSKSLIYGASIGYSIHKKGEEFSKTIEEADENMYLDKLKGRKKKKL